MRELAKKILHELELVWGESVGSLEGDFYATERLAALLEAEDGWRDEDEEENMEDLDCNNPNCPCVDCFKSKITV